MSVSSDTLLSRLRVAAEEDWPEILELRAAETDLQLQLRVPQGLSVFAGHFPSQPVLPGVLQIHWAARLAELSYSYLRNQESQFSQLRGIKFNSVVLPDQLLQLDLQLNPDKHLVKFNYSDSQEKYSSGLLQFRSRPTPPEAL